MSDAIIKVEGLGKKYIISHEQQGGGYTALRDVISSKAKAVLQKKEQLPPKEEFWALKDVNFEIKKGDAVGIIGRNGAGKSTLLKILSRITEPTHGRIELNGRVASLLEVGTGFHPELTGRENIFLNGAILGMSRAEIKRKFDEIVDFSGVEKFLDTPVKRYSSGMYVRLAFSVAAHLEPEILVVDEVLAVGDAEFQKKCLGKMGEVSKNQGRTVLFVSHNMAAVKQLCNTSLFLKQGQVKQIGLTSDVLSAYKNDIVDIDNANWSSLENSYFEIMDFQLHNEKYQEQINIDDEVTLLITFRCKTEKKSLALSYNVFNEDDLLLFEAFVPFANEKNSKKTIYCISVKIPRYTLNSGEYYINLIFGEDQQNVVLSADRIKKFLIEEKFIESGKYLRKRPGVIRPKITYDVKEIN